MALEQEVQALQNDITSTQQLADAMTAAAPGLAQALVLAGQFAATLTSASQQLATLAAGVIDATSATQAQASEAQIQQQCQAAARSLAPAAQAWSTAASLSQQRAVWLLSRWQQCHAEPTAGAPTAMSDPLAQSLAAYNAAVTQLSATIQQSTQFPSPAPPVTTNGGTGTSPAAEALPVPGPDTPAIIAAWLEECSLVVASAAAQITADTAHLTTTLTWTTIESTATSAVAAAQGWLAQAQRIAAALTGPVDPASLSDRLSDLTALRVSICPDPITPADRSLYNQRMAELDQALSELLAAPTGATAASPVAMLGVRLETRMFPAPSGGTEIRIRVYPDSLQADAHDPRLTTDEAQWSEYIQTLTADGAQLPQDEWAQLAARFGPARAAYLLSPDPSAGARSGPWTRPATTAALPDHWLAVAYGPDGTMIGAAAGAPISPLPIQVSPNPAAEPAGEPDDLQIDPAVRWMIDFDTAVSQGMGISLTVDGGAAGTPAPGQETGPATLSRLAVIGVQVADATATLTNLLNAHRYTSGLELISYATPSNNTSQAPAGFSRSDPGYGRSYTLEVLKPAAVTGDAPRLAAALGMDPEVLAAAAMAPLTGHTDQQAMTALTWPATWGSFLTGFTGMSQATEEALRSWAVAWLRPEGPLPTIAIGPRIYGIVPVVALDQWTDASETVATRIHGVIQGLLPYWLAADPSAAGLDFDTLLSRRPVSTEAWGRAAAIMPGWLQAGYDLMGITNSQIAAITTSTLPAQLTQIGTAAGLPGPLPWPAGILVVPDPEAPAAPWPLVLPDGQLPFTADTDATQQPAGYLPGLLTASPPASPATLLQFVASQSCAATPGVATPTVTLTPRGNLGDIAEPTPPSAAAELSTAVTYLAGRTDADFDSLFGGALDAATHRLDAWATSLATRRLGELRATSKTGILIGGFGWVENLVARPPLSPAGIPDEPGALADLYNAGYQVAPSLQQATTAAVLRGGYLTHHPIAPGTQAPPAGAPFSIDLSSRRARLATWLLDGIRQGEPLSVLLGYRFERILQESGLGALIPSFRLAAPYDPVITSADGDTSNGAPTEAAVPTDVVDGVALTQAAPSQPGPPTADQWAQAQPALTELTDALDAVADAVAAQALHDSLTGNTFAAAATLDGVASGTVPPPELTFLSTVRTGIAVDHRILVPAALPDPPAGWPATPQSTAEPGLTGWIASLLGDPSQITAAVTLTDATGAPVPGDPATITLGGLGLGPLDVVAMAGRPAELERLAVYTVLSTRPGTDPPATDGTLDPSPAGAARPLSAVLSIALAAGQVIGAGRSADARDLSPAGTVTDPGVNTADLADRVDGTTGVTAELASAATALAAALPGDPAPGSAQAAPTGVPAGADPATLAAALIQALLLGVTGAAPAGTGPGALPALVDQARGAWSEILSRQAAVSALADDAANSDLVVQLTARLGQLAAAFGGGFRALPQVTTTPADLLGQASAMTTITTSDAGQGPDAWLVKASRVHQPVADLLDACCAAEALGTGPSLTISIAQLPLPQPATGGTAQPAPWAGQPFTGQPPPANCLSLAMVSAPPPGSPLSALVVADWVEVIPSPREIAGLTYHYDAPDAQAPQAVLLAVPADLSSTGWAYSDLIATVTTARNLAHARGADYNDLPAAARQVLPAAYFTNPTELKPGPWPAILAQLDVPPGYMVQTPGAVTISSVTVAGGALEQGMSGQITVTGLNFAPPGAPLPYSAFTVVGGGVTVTGSTSPITNTIATLNVTVDPDAATGIRDVTVGTASLAGCVTINPQPRATACNTTRLAQALTPVTQTILVTGQAFAGASIVGAGSPLVTWQLAGTTSSHLSVTVSIAASTYNPYQPPKTAGSPLVARPGLTNGGSPNGGHPVPDPQPRPRPPQHITIPLILTVNPGSNGPTATFNILLDAIV